MKHLSMALCTVVVLFAGCDSEPAMVRQMRKERLTSAIRHRLLESVEAEKSAVLATTDQESQVMALEGHKAAADINQLRSELRPLIVADGHRLEIEKLDAFDATWAEFERIDKRLLALAVANTNLKAARLLSREGAASLDRFVDELTQIQRGLTDPEMMRTLTRASVAALRGQSLLFVHIPSPDDAEMTRLEQRLRELNGEVELSLASARQSGLAAPERLVTASQAWSEYQRLTTEVIRLSRENSNVISFDVSIHEKRHATKECLAALAALSAAFDVGPHPAR